LLHHKREAAAGSAYSQLFHLSTTIHRTRILLD
jgi:hypothetical protein